MNKDLVDLESIIPGICIDLKYSTADNFLAAVVYDFKTCLLHKDGSLHLLDVQNELKAMGLELKVFDGYRPMRAQQLFWEKLPDPRYISDPKLGGRHTRGTAVDVTLIFSGTKKELAMPSAFDDFSEKSHRGYVGASKEEIFNRELLQDVMGRHGWVGLPTEWWHFDLVGWESYPVI
jgi:D-alanyl-D-alanine dipeptidase